jgi:PAS domain S-box-containing protein
MSRAAISNDQSEAPANAVPGEGGGVSWEAQELRRLRETLRQREWELNEARRLAGIGTWRYDCDSGLTTWSDDVYRLLGWDPGEPPMRYSEFRARTDHSANDKAFIEVFERTLETGEPYALDTEITRPDGEKRWVVSRGEVDQWVNGKVGGKVASLRGTVMEITERKRAEEEIRLARQRLESVLESITDGLCVLDRDLTYVYFNENGARLVGLRPEQIVGTRVGDTFAENKTNMVGQMYRQSLATGLPVHVEEYSVAPLDKWFESNCYPSPNGLTVYFRDITERKRTEEALRESEQRFRQLFSSSMMGICIPDRYGAFKEGNDELLRMTGYSREELAAGLVRWDTMTPPEYRHLDEEHIAEAAVRGSCTPYEKEYIRKDGSRVPILCGYALLEGSEDEYIGFVIDITERKRTEAALRESEQRFRLLADSLPELVWVTDAYGSLTYLNSRFLSYCGIAPDRMTGFDWGQILHEEESERVFEAWTHTVATGKPYLIELQLRAADGSYRYFLARAVAMLGGDGEVERWVGSCTDIHDQKLAEEALRRSEKLAATGRLAASIAHEINNPLESVTNLMYLALSDGAISEETRGYLEAADQELARITHITTQTLRFHRQSKSAAVADLSEIMRSVLALFRSRFVSRRIEVTGEFDANTRICCFADELRQVFTNLVSNSHDATPDGGMLRIRIKRATACGVDGVRVTVADTGCGIPAEIQQRIFEPFFSTKDATGIGLGLWVTDGILKKHSARMSLRSCTGAERHGTTFSVFFPEGGVDLSS